MTAPYNLSLTAAQIDAALLAASDSDQAPASGDTNLVNSKRIYDFVTGQVGSEATIRAAADTALDARVSALEDGGSIARFTKDGNVNGSGNLSSYTETDPDGIASESSGEITLAAGTYIVSINGNYTQSSASSTNNYSITYTIGSELPSVRTSENALESLSHSASQVVVSDGSAIVKIYALRNAGLNYQLTYDVDIQIYKLK
jgi:hypothetical protein